MRDLSVFRSNGGTKALLITLDGSRGVPPQEVLDEFHPCFLTFFGMKLGGNKASPLNRASKGDSVFGFGSD